MPSKRRQILSAVKTKLQNITVANGYNHNLKKASYGFQMYNNVVEFPSCYMITYPAGYVPLTNEEYTSGGDRLGIDGWRIQIVGYVKTSLGEERLTDEQEDLIEDIVKAMLVDHTLGLSSFVNNCYLVEIDSSVDIQANVGVVVITFNIKYDFDKDVP